LQFAVSPDSLQHFKEGNMWGSFGILGTKEKDRNEKCKEKSSRPYDFNIKLYAILSFKEDTNNEMRPI